MLVYNVTPNIVEDWNEYWAIHFCSILEFLHYHKQMSEKPTELVGYPNWTLNELRGHISQGYYYDIAIQGAMKNWAFQYFLVNYLNNNMGFNVVNKIVEIINGIYNSYVIRDFTQFKFILTGKDSSLSDSINIKEFNSFIPYLARNNIDYSISNSDLLLKLTDSFGYSQGVFCEVESKYGKVSGSNYWEKKNHSIVSFSVENNQTYDKGIFLQTEYLNGLSRIKIFFNSTNSVVSDFNMVLSWIIRVISEGKRFELRRGNDIFDYFIDLLIQDWNQPVTNTIDTIKSFIKNRDFFLNEQHVNVPKLNLYYVTHKPSLFLSDNLGWRYLT